MCGDFISSGPLSQTRSQCLAHSQQPDCHSQPHDVSSEKMIFLSGNNPEKMLSFGGTRIFFFLQFCLIFHQQFPAINTIVLFWDWFLAVLQFGNNAKMLSLHDWLVMPSEMPQSLRGPFYSVFIEPNLHAPHIITTATVKPLNLFDKCRFQLLQVSYNRFTRAQYASP